MRSVCLHTGNQIGDEVVAALEFSVDVGPGVLNVITNGDEAIVDSDHEDQWQ